MELTVKNFNISVVHRKTDFYGGGGLPKGIAIKGGLKSAQIYGGSLARKRGWFF